jgi:hypothetical protein
LGASRFVSNGVAVRNPKIADSINDGRFFTLFNS